MGITLVPFANGDVMDSEDMRDALEAIRLFQNRGIVAGDLAGTFRSRHFKHMESYGAPAPRTTGVSGAIHSRMQENGTVRSNSAIFTYDANGPAWENVWAANGTIWIEQASRVEITACVWAWHIRTEQIEPEIGSYTSRFREAASVRLAIGSDGLGYTGRRVWDAGSDATTDLSGPFRYPARQIGMVGSANVTAGRKQIGVQVFMEEMTDLADSGFLYVRARVMNVEVYRR